MIHRAVLALGSNVGDPIATLQGAVVALATTAGLRIVAVSSPYRTAPVGGPEQGDFVNAVLLVETTLGPHELLEICQSVEADFHRVREVRWGPRTLDIDVIDFDGIVDDDPVLSLPHPRAAERAFVCVPWSEIDPDAVVPGRGRVMDLLDVLDMSGVHRITSTVLAVPGSVS